MGGIKDLMGLLFLMDSRKETPLGTVIQGKRKLPKEKNDILKALAIEKVQKNNSEYKPEANR